MTGVLRGPGMDGRCCAHLHLEYSALSRCTQANLDEHLVIGRLFVDLDLYLDHLFVDVDD